MRSAGITDSFEGEGANSRVGGLLEDSRYLSVEGLWCDAPDYVILIDSGALTTLLTPVVLDEAAVAVIPLAILTRSCSQDQLTTRSGMIRVRAVPGAESGTLKLLKVIRRRVSRLAMDSLHSQHQLIISRPPQR